MEDLANSTLSRWPANRMGKTGACPSEEQPFLGLDVRSRSSYPSIVPVDGVSNGQSYPGHGQKTMCPNGD